MEPHLLHPDLLPERLKVIGRLLKIGRNDALIRYQPEIGDDGWSLGCRAFQCSYYQIVRAAVSGEYDWLTVMDRTKRLVFRIGRVPIRFFRGTPELPTSRTLRQSHPELAQLSLVFQDEPSTRDYVFRLVVETDIEGSISSIKLVGYQGSTPRYTWEIPLDYYPETLYPLPSGQAEGVELPAPFVDWKHEEGTGRANEPGAGR